MTTSRRFSLLAGLAILLLAILLRAPSLVAARPYINYIDEGNYLYPVAKMLRAGEWDPRWYMYPQLPVTLAAAGARLYAPFHPARHDGRTFDEDLPVRRVVYDTLGPFEFLLVGRVLSLLASLGVVVLTGLYGRRLLGTPSGLFAAFLAAWLPPLVVRGSIATVDPWAALFALGCFFFADRVRTSGRPGREVFLAGAMAGLAFASKYPAVLAACGAGLTLLLEDRSWREKCRWLALGAAGTLAGMLAGMPALVLHPREVWVSLRNQNEIYSSFVPTPRLWEQAIIWAEWDVAYGHPELGIPVLLLAAAGAVAALRDRRLAKTAAGWLLFVAVALALYLPKNFQAFRNLLPHMPLLCLLVAVLHARLRERLARPLWADAGAVLVVLALFGQPVSRWAMQRAVFPDSRREAIDWLAGNAGPNDSVLVLRELAFVRGELDRLEGRRLVQRRWPQALSAIRGRQLKFLLVGQLGQKEAPLLDLAQHPAVRRGYVLRARFGESATPADPGLWRGNRQVVYVFEKKVRPWKGKGLSRGAHGGAHGRGRPSGLEGEVSGAEMK